MVLAQRPVVLFAAAVAWFGSGCTSFTSAEEGSAEASDGVTDPSGGSSEGSGVTDPTAASASGSTASASTTTGPSGTTTDASASGPTTADPTTEAEGSTVTSTAGTASDSETGLDDSTSTSDASSSSSTSMEIDPADLLGMGCEDDKECAVDAGQECCTADQCLGTCMVPCDTVDDCPELNMGCEHGYCLFPCNDNDEDCSPWPGYQCDHDGQYCEND